MMITIRDGETFYKASVTAQWANKHDNGALISCGLAVGENLTRTSLNILIRQKRAYLISKEDYNHSGCQSRCIRRGDSICQW